MLLSLQPVSNLHSHTAPTHDTHHPHNQLRVQPPQTQPYPPPSPPCICSKGNGPSCALAAPALEAMIFPVPLLHLQVTIPENGQSFCLIYSIEDPGDPNSPVGGVGAQVGACGL